MDLWAWVHDAEKRLREQGQGRLADLMDRIPNEVVNDRHEKADACAREGIALAQSLEEPWVELFMRHWWLQSRILHRMDGRALGEAVALVDFGHSEATRGCPQSVCSVQDLAAGYGYVDGPGYAEQRIEVARETLERIDPSWSCFTCITSEHANALHDRGDDAEALTLIDRAAAELAANGERDGLYDMARPRMDSLLALGRYEEALAFLTEDERRGRHNEHDTRLRRIERARILVGLGRAAEARAALPLPDDIAATPLFFRPWAGAADQLVRAGVMTNDFRLGATLQRFTEKLAQQGIGRATLELAEIAGHLAIDRGAPAVARRALAAMEAATSLLHRPLDALDRIGKLRTAIAQASTRVMTLPETAELALASLATDAPRDPEKELQFLEAAHARFPDDEAVVLTLTDCLCASGLATEAIPVLDAFHQRNPAEDIVMRLGALVLDDPEALAKLVARHHERAPHAASRALADWLLARAAQARGEWAASRQHLDAVLAGRPAAINARVMYSEASRRLGDLPIALAKLDEAAALGPEIHAVHWERLIVATLLSEHARVRESAKAIGFEFEGEGAIDEPMALCRIRFPDASRDVWATRISPVAARILEIASPPEPLRYRDVVVFDAKALNPPPADDEARRDHTFVFPQVATLTKGNYRAYFLEGIHPGEKAVEIIRQTLAAVGSDFRILNSDQYSIQDQPGIYAGVALSPEADVTAVCAALLVATGGYQVTFTELARDAGNAALAEEHAALAETLGL